VATPKPRRGSKAGKKDMNLTNPATPEPVTPLPQAEVVSRSGRKIKPKRFADEEVQFSTPAGAKSSQATEDGKSNEVSPAKRTKRTGSVGSKAPVTPLPAVVSILYFLPLDCLLWKRDPLSYGTKLVCIILRKRNRKLFRHPRRWRGQNWLENEPTKDGRQARRLVVRDLPMSLQ